MNTMPSCDPLEALNEALCREQEGHKFYLRAAEKTENPRGREMLLSLAKQTTAQIDLLETQIEALTENNIWMLPECVLACDYDLADPPYPRDPVSFEQQIRPDTDDVDAILFALQAENTNYGAYVDHAQAATHEQARQFYTYLAEQTRTRLDLLMLNYEGNPVPGSLG